MLAREGLAPLVEVCEFEGDWSACLETASNVGGGGGVSPSVVTYSSSAGSSGGETETCAFAREGRRARTFLATIF